MFPAERDDLFLIHMVVMHSYKPLTGTETSNHSGTQTKDAENQVESIRQESAEPSRKRRRKETPEVSDEVPPLLDVDVVDLTQDQPDVPPDDPQVDEMFRNFLKSHAKHSRLPKFQSFVKG